MTLCWSNYEKKSKEHAQKTNLKSLNYLVIFLLLEKRVWKRVGGTFS